MLTLSETKSVLIGYCGPLNEISMHGRSETLGALPEAGAQSAGEFQPLTCKTCILCGRVLAFQRLAAKVPLFPFV